MQIKLKENLIEVIYDVSVKEPMDQLIQAQDLLNQVTKIYQEHPFERYSILLDLSKEGLHVSIESLESVEMYERIVDNSQTYRLAVLGRESFADPIIEVAFSKIAEKKVRWFTDREKALWWLEGAKAKED